MEPGPEHSPYYSLPPEQEQEAERVEQPGVEEETNERSFGEVVVELEDTIRKLLHGQRSTALSVGSRNYSLLNPGSPGIGYGRDEDFFHLKVSNAQRPDMPRVETIFHGGSSVEFVLGDKTVFSNLSRQGAPLEGTVKQKLEEFLRDLKTQITEREIQTGEQGMSVAEVASLLEHI